MEDKRLKSIKKSNEAIFKKAEAREKAGGEFFETGSMDVDANFVNTLSPIVTTGYDYRFKNNWTLSGEIGAVYTGGVDLSATSATAEIQTAIDASEDYRSARNDASDVTFLPYISVTVGYSF